MTSRLRVWLERVCSEELLETIVLPALADLEHEQTVAGSRATRHVAFVQGLWGLIKALFLVSLWRTAHDTRAMFPTLAIRFAVVLTFVTSVLVLPPTRHTLERLDISHSLLTLVYLSPQAMAVAFPIAAFVAVVMHGIATRASAPALMRGILPFVLGLSLASLVLTFWVMPASNQAFRMLVYNASRPATEAFRDLPKGMNERSWIELTELSATGTVAQATQARTALRIKYAIAIVTCLSGLIAVPLAIFIRPRAHRLFRRSTR